MQAFRVVLIAVWFYVVALTVRAVSREGIAHSVFVYFGDFVYPWRAQFNGDFLGYLLLGALWIVYREKNRWVGISLGIAEFLAENVVLIPYILFSLFRAKGRFDALLLGHHFQSK